MQYILNLVRNRNFVLVLAVVVGLALGDWAVYIKSYTTWILAVVMTFSMTNIRTSSLYPLRSLVKPMMTGILLNYVLYAIVMIGLAWFIIDDKELFYGFVVIATTPPGVAIIPFSYILKGDVEYSIKGVLGAFLCTVFVTPFIVGWITGNDGIESFGLFMLMVKTIVIPLIISRILLLPLPFKLVDKLRGKVVDWGFALLIFIAVGLNRKVFFSEPGILIKIALILFLTHFVLGLAYEKMCKVLKRNEVKAMSENLLLTIKSSGFAVVTAITLFGQKAAIPTAGLAIFVLLYLLFLSFRMELKEKSRQKN
ncbi:bile acid:sodium symporter family protein [Carboxylicivirga sp. RSCT41]|uniref:bile acid:sodium symporter family protein n=1 Tax=Carboxylicivirga agarovorans TaxID=3417570 RepID=UPI003D329442